MIDYDGMTENDRNNLNFLLNATPEVLQDWIMCVEEDDIDYAIELLEMLRLRMIDIYVTDTSEAKQILSKYTLT